METEELEVTLQEVEGDVQALTSAEQQVSAGQLVYIVAAAILIVLQVWNNRKSKQVVDHSEKTNENATDIKKMLAENTAALNSLKDKVDNVDDTLMSNNRVTVSTARAALKSIYDRLKPKKQLTMTEKAMIEEMYQAYKSVTLPDGHHPNSWCDAIIEEMRTWKVVDG